MILGLFSIFDEKAGAFAHPLTFRSKGEAIRAFTDAVNAPDSPFFKHPNDFYMYKLGEYDDNSGVVQPMKEPVITGAECRASQDPLK